MWELGRRLAMGEAPQSIIDGREPAGLILSHMVEGTLDDEYQRSLRLHHLMHPVAGTTTRRTILRKVGANLAGAVLNVVDMKSRGYYGYYGYGYGYSYGETKKKGRKTPSRRHSRARGHRPAPPTPEVSDVSVS